jgi:NADPH:quinone reductase-like Zn-dependent oxidoreductase
MTSPAKSEAVIALGAVKTLAREDSVVAKLGCSSIDVVVDLVAGPQWPEFLDALRPGGRYAVAGAIGGPIVELDVRTLYLKDLSLLGCTVLETEVFSNLIEHIERERISPIVAETFPLEQIADAQLMFMSKEHIGKIVLTVDTLD